MHEPRNRGTARRRWRFILLRTAHPENGGGSWGSCGGLPWVVRGWGRARSCRCTCFSKREEARGGGSASDMRGTIAAVRLADDLGWIAPTVAPVHRRLAKCGEGPGFQFYLSARALREAAGRGWGVPEGKPVVALMCLSWFAFLRVAEAASVRAADVRGDRALGFWATKRGKVGRRWIIWCKWSRALGGFP